MDVLPAHIPHPIAVDRSAVARLAESLRARAERPLVVADERTHLAWPVDVQLRGYGLNPLVLILPGEPVANEEFVARVAAVLEPGVVPLALGAGTLTDIVRYAAFERGRDWIALPTAPSVDGFVSSVAAMTWGGAKISSPASPPAALFAVPEVLAAAPRPLIAAGAGDILGKFTSVADWRLGALLYGEPYSEERAETTLSLARRVADLAPALGRGDQAAAASLMDALIGSGLVMLEQGDSRPASGSEHHIAHVWEMKLIREGRPPVLHGAKVGVASLYAARLWRLVADTPAERAAEWVRGAVAPSVESDERVIREGFGSAAASLIDSRRRFAVWTPDRFGALMENVVAAWSEVRAIAASVPRPEELASWLRACGAPTTPGELGLADDLDEALRLGPYLRDRLTVARLLTLLGIDVARAC